MNFSFPSKRLLGFLQQESDHPQTRLLVFSLIAGMANGALLAVINHGAGLVNEFSTEGTVQIYYLAMFCAVLGLFTYTKKYTLDQAAVMVEQVLLKVRKRISDKLRHTELEFIENYGYSHIYNCLFQDTLQISQSSAVVFASIQAAIMLGFAMLYIVWLTPEGFLLTIGAIGLGAWVFLLKRAVIIRDIQEATQQEARFFDAIEHTLEGFKEVKINRAKSLDLYQHQSRIASVVQVLKSRTGINSVFVTMFSEVFFYILIAVILFVWPYFQTTDPGTIIKLTASVLFIIGPLDLLFGSLPLFVKADAAVANLRHLELQVDEASRGAQTGEPAATVMPLFEQLEFRDVCFEYQNVEEKQRFKVGPISLKVKAGEIIFIVGGNGSGKSTLLKLLTGLYYPTQGQIEVNGESLDRELYPDYREFFGIVFTDFHLFDRFYGAVDINEKQVRMLIKDMGLADKTKFRDGAFTNINLSTGQRKRLALINAIADDRQIYVFDELAADQDPEFRRHLYEELLPDLRRLGKTIIAVTHDDKYFSHADRVIKMEEGHMREETLP